MAQESTDRGFAQGLSEGTGASGTPEASSAFAVGGITVANGVFLAPLSGITDVPFRRLARRFGAGLVVSEMVASAEFARGHPESALRAMRDGAGTHVVQLAGRDPAWMRAAAERLAGEGVDLIDINMGCPAKKVVGGLSGSALMREPDLALRLIEATVAGAGGVPVTLKMRLGWDAATINAPELAKRAEAAGVAMVTVHGRTRAQFYEGRADWAAIAAVKRAVSVPLVANGDLVASGDRARMLRISGADAVMIGRGAQGRPWFPGLVAGAVGPAELARIRLADLVAEHYEAMLAHYGPSMGLRHARKHLGWYVERFAPLAVPGALAAERAALLGSGDPAAVLARLRQLFSAATLADLEAAPEAPAAEAA